MKVEIRSTETIIDGYVNAVGRDSRLFSSKYHPDKGKFVEQIEPGAFSRSLARNPNVDLKYNHGAVLGSTATGELSLYEDNIGLKAHAVTSDPAMRERADRKELRGWSFGMIVNKERWEDTGKGYERRVVEELDLYEVSILDKTPVYVGTSIEERADELELELRANEEPETIEPAAPEIIEQPETATEPEKEHVESRAFLIPISEAEIEIIKLRGGLTHEKKS